MNRLHCRMRAPEHRLNWIALTLTTCIAACGGGSPDAPADHTVGGSVSGLASMDGLVLQNNAGDDLAVDGNGRFTMPTAQRSGTTYSVTVKKQPTSPPQGCAVSNGDGMVEAGDVKNVDVSCTRLVFPGAADTPVEIRSMATEDADGPAAVPRLVTHRST